MLDADAAGGSDAAQLLAALQARKDAAEARVDAVQVQLAAARDELSRLQGRQKEAQALPQVLWAGGAAPPPRAWRPRVRAALARLDAGLCHQCQPACVCLLHGPCV